MLPVLLLIVLAALDFGRLFLGWVVLNNAARVGANYAALYPDAWDMPGNAARQGTYDALVQDAREDAQISLEGCASEAIPDPAFPGGKDLGDHAEVELRCGFRPLTPLIGDIFGGGGAPLTVTARSVFPIRIGAVDAPPVTPAPVCLSAFDWQADADDTLTVHFQDTTNGGGSPFLWDFGDARASTEQHPSHTYRDPGTYRVVFRVSGCTPLAKDVTVIAPPPSPDPSASPGPSVSPGPSASPDPGCVVPSFIGSRKNDAPGTWSDEGFTTSIVFDPNPNGNWRIQAQSLVGGFPQPCNVSITLGPDPLPSAAP